MKLLDEFFEIRKEIFEYFGYIEDWRVLPLDDATDYYWQLNQEKDGSGTVKFAESIKQFNSDGDYYKNEIYTQRHLPKWVYRGKDYTMVVVDTHTDGNQFLQIFDNKKEIV
jgi:hypothetical protein